MKTLLIVALIVTGALAAGQGNRMMSYASFDTDGNGKITKVEFEETQAKRMAAQAEAGRMMRNAANAPQFSDIDANQDGIIDQAEFAKHQASRRGQGNRNGKGMNR